MAEVDFKTILINSFLSLILFLAMVGFVNQYLIDNGSNETLLNDPTFNATVTLMNQNLTDSQSQTANQSGNQDRSNPIAIFDFLSEAIVGTVKIFKGIFKEFYNISFGLIQDKLGIPDVVLYTLTSIVLVSLIFYGWRTWKRG